MSDTASSRQDAHSRRPIRAVTFDFWGTLYRNGPDVTPVYMQILAGAVPGAPPQALHAALDAARSIAGEIGKRGFRLPVEARVAIILDTLGTSLVPDARTRLVTEMEEALYASPPRPVRGAPDVLRALHNDGYALALISDTDMAPGRVIRQIMRQDGLADFFQYCTFSDELGVSKHWREAFWSTCAALGVAPDEALHVGDLPETDMRVGKAAGLRTALATYVSRRGDDTSAADVVLESLTDLPAALARLQDS